MNDPTTTDALSLCFAALGVLAEALHVSIGWLVGGDDEA